MTDTEEMNKKRTKSIRRPKGKGEEKKAKKKEEEKRSIQARKCMFSGRKKNEERGKKRELEVYIMKSRRKKTPCRK